MTPRQRRADSAGAELHLLTGAYAIDALSELERAAFTRHLVDCGPCAQEVRELQATAARLAEASAEPPPPELRERVLAAAGGVRQLPPGAPEPAPRAARPWVSRVVGAAAAVLLLVVGGLGVVNRALDRRAAEAELLASQVASVLSAPDARTVPARGTGPGTVTVVVSRTRGRAVVAASGLPRPGADRTYQLWLVPPGGAPRPAGLLEPSQRGSATVLVEGDPGTAAAVAVTVEPAGGSPAPTSAPTYIAPLPSGWRG